jgi:acetylglutamate kinase
MAVGREDGGPGEASPRLRYVVKLGGDVLDHKGGAESSVRADLARALAEAQLRGRGVVVHGGGAQVTALATRLGLPTHMVAGRRITDAATLEVMTMVVAGRLNVELCAALQGVGVTAVGLHAGSGVIRARRRPPRVMSGAGPDPIDFGLVGDVTGFDLALLETLAGAGYLPVLSCLGIDPGGQVLNLNADLAASQLAIAARAEALIAVTAVGGVRRDLADPASRIARMTVAEARAAIGDGTVKGGMIPKLEEATAAIAAGVSRVEIVAPHEIVAALLRPGSAGTQLVP